MKWNADLLYIASHVFFNRLGVTQVDANVEAQNVAVTCDEGVVVDDLLAALMKWSASSGKSVKLA